MAEAGRRARRAWVRLDRYRHTQVRDVTPDGPAPHLVNATCRVCGQEEGPFCDVTEAVRVLERRGWLRRRPAESWENGRWADVPDEWWCPHCRALWDHERCKRQGTTYGGSVFTARSSRHLIGTARWPTLRDVSIEEVTAGG